MRPEDESEGQIRQPPSARGLLLVVRSPKSNNGRPEWQNTGMD
jgi:hypothetical protein